METHHALNVHKGLGMIETVKHHAHHAQLELTTTKLAHHINHHAFHVQTEATAQLEALHVVHVSTR